MFMMELVYLNFDLLFSRVECLYRASNASDAGEPSQLENLLNI